MAAAMTESIVELQKAADSIREGLKIVNEDIKKLTGRDPAEFRTPGNRRVQLKRNFNQQRDLGGPVSKRLSQDGGGRRWGRTVVASRIRPNESQEDQDSSGEDEAVPQKPAVQSSVVATPKTQDLEPKPKLEDRTTQLRNKRMFGLLLGTLKKFKDDDKVRSEKDKRREAIEKKLDDQAQQEKANIASQKKELFQSRRQKQIELRRLEHKMEIAELKTEIEARNGHLKHFIKLKSSPTLYYLPKIHNDKTEQLLKASAKEIEDLQKQRFKEMDLSDDEPDSKPEEADKLPVLSSVVMAMNDTQSHEERIVVEEREDDNKMEEQSNDQNTDIRIVENGEYTFGVKEGENVEQEREEENVNDSELKETQSDDEKADLEQSTSEQIDAHELLEQLVS